MGGSVSLDGAVLPDGFSSLLINNSATATNVTFSNFSGAYELNTTRSDITADGLFQLDYLESAIITVNDNGGSKYLNVNRFGTSGGALKALWDGDKDTGIQVEESIDEDIIRFDTAGFEYFNMNGPRLSVLNSGNSVFIGEGAGTHDDLSDNNNVFIGTEAGNANVSGAFNTAVGFQSLIGNTAGLNNTAIGYQAIGRNSTGNNNAAFGTLSLFENTTGSDNAALGDFAGRYTNAGAGNQTSTSSLYLGYDTRSSASGNTNEIVIGATARGLGSNTAVYGNNSILKHVFSRGNVGIGGITDPTEALDVNGSVNVRSGLSGGHNNMGGNFHIDSAPVVNSGIYLNWSGGGTSTIVGNGAGGPGPISAAAFNVASDQRLKENIQSTRYGLESVLKMEVKDYNYISDKQQTLSTGFMAQDLVKIFPAAVTVGTDEVDADGNLKRPWSIDYSKLTPVIVKALQEQQVVIDDLVKRIERLENE